MLFLCFAWLVWLLCACGVRRIYDLWRVCLSFYLSLPPFSSSLTCFCPFACPFLSLLQLSSGCPLSLPCLSLWVVVSFSLTDYTQKERAQRFVPCVLSCPIVGCFIWLRLYTPRTRQVSARLYRNKVLEKGNLNECSKLFCARLCSYLYSSKFVLFLFSYLLRLVGSYFLSPFRLLGCFWYYETIASRFDSERAPSYPSHGKLKGIV